MTFENYIDTVFPNRIQKWDQLSENLCEGNLKFKEILDFFKNKNYDWESEFRTLMEYQKLDHKKINIPPLDELKNNLISDVITEEMLHEFLQNQEII